MPIQRWQGLATLVVLVALASTRPATAGWDVKPDPSTKAVQLSVKPGMTLPLPSRPGLSPLYPNGPSPFVAVGQNGSDTDVREVWDLRTFQRNGSIKGKLGSSASSPLRLSLDGTFLAVTATDTDPDRVVEGLVVRRRETREADRAETEGQENPRFRFCGRRPARRRHRGGGR